MATTTEPVDILSGVWAAAELRMVGDGVFYPDILRMRRSIASWSEWLGRWAELGEEYEQLAREALAAGHRVTAGEHFWEAALSWHFGQFLWFQAPPEKEAAQQRKAAVYREGAPLFVPAAQRCDIDFEGTTIPGYLRVPPAVGKAPCVILIGGLDSTKEESLMMENTLLRRGLATFTFDGPGQGEYFFQRKLVPDFERYASRVVDYLQQREEVDGERLGLMGRSLGGYYAARTAAREARVKACVIFGALFDLGAFDSLPPQTKRGFLYITGLEDGVAARRRAEEWIDLGDLPRDIRQPLYILHGARDALIPVEQAERLYRQAGSADKVLRVYPDGIHCAHNLFHRVRRPMADWLADHLGARPDPAMA